MAARVRVVADGRLLADTRRALRVVETAWRAGLTYLPLADVDAGRLQAAARTTVCEWKGAARYLDYADGDHRIPAIGWTYPGPNPDYRAIRDHVAFYAGLVDEAWVGDDPANLRSRAASTAAG